MHERFTALGYRVHLAEDDGVRIATAHRLVSGDAFGPPFPDDRDGWRASLRNALVRLYDLRRDLDTIREQKPWPH
jgi:hypothetical protein